MPIKEMKAKTEMKRRWYPMQPIVIASPHKRNDSLENQLRERLTRREIVRISDKTSLTLETLEQLKPEYIFFPHWSWIIPHEIHAQFVCIIFHMTDLPYGRGGSPLQNLIVRGHTETMLTALRCVKEIDAGPIYSKQKLSLQGSAEEILQRASNLMVDMVVSIVANSQEPVAQQDPVVEFKRRQPKDGDISAIESLEQIYDFIRMLDGDGYPPAFIDTPVLRLEFSEANLDSDFVEARVRIRRKQEP